MLPDGWEPEREDEEPQERPELEPLDPEREVIVPFELELPEEELLPDTYL